MIRILPPCGAGNSNSRVDRPPDAGAPVASLAFELSSFEFVDRIDVETAAALRQ
jgi:hypothetical protein